jgi:flagellar assembly protein FliH
MSLSSQKSLPSSFQLLTYSRLESGGNPQPAAKTEKGSAPTYQMPDFGTPRSPAQLPRGSNFKGMNFPHVRPDDKVQEEVSAAATRAAEELREKIRREAELEAEIILETARREAETLRKQAESEAANRRQELFAEARQEGLGKAEAENREQQQQLDTLIERLSVVYECCRREHEKELVNLALNCARRLVNREIARDESVILDCIEEVFSTSSLRGEITLRLNPDDIAVVEARRNQLLAEFPGLEKLKIEAGAGIERGGCLLESSLGRIDATLAGKFEELQHLLKEQSD